MNKSIATTARGLTICIAATLGFNAASASTDGASSGRKQRFGPKLTSKLNHNIRRKSGAPSGFPDGLPAFCFIETIRLSFIRGQKRIQPFDTDYGVYIDDRFEIRRRRAQGCGEISFDHK
jgi:hypothetical protein